ncbi:leucine-rich repeat-containing protein 3C isoform X1 [Myotis lucifugus]|uniref:leucine-rich repeat-containing protein 3C isoform X1 n=1 Tax=Myotis lucifugus TaxID=59463 RepID=UPI0003C459AF|nr:leucine-rich repeat-containing protein 3C isoform X1 [Myotis lucifugus]
MTAAGLGRGARGREWKWRLVSPGRVHQGPGSALSWHRLARPWLRYLIPGARSHMPGNPIRLGPSPQLPAAMSKQDFWRRKRVSRAEQQGGYFREGGSPGEGSPPNRVPTGLLVPTWPAWQPPRSYSVPGLCQSAAMLAPASHLLSLLLVMGTGGTMPSPQGPPQGCYMAEEAGERTFRCSQAGLTAVPTGIPNDTRKLYLDANRLASVPAGAFQHLPVLEELDLSHNVLAHLSGAAFQGLGTLRHLDLSANQLASVPAEAFVGLQIQVNLSANPWRCDCALQEVLRQVRLAPGTGTGIVCGPGARPDLVGQEFLLLAGEEELCGPGRGGARRSTDVALLVTMGGWLALVVAYLAHYVWQNRDETRRPLKRAPVLPVRSEDSSTLSTMV